MAAKNWLACVEFVLREEGGFVNDPIDPGGATNFGITQTTYNSWRRLKGLPTEGVRRISIGVAREIYQVQYWNQIGGDQLVGGIDLMIFDEAVNSGIRRAVKDLQFELGVRQDGIVGLKTLDGLKQIADLPGLISKLSARRMGMLRRLRTWWRFGKGWSARVEACAELALELTKS